jgi:hypothetical protein
MVQLRYRLNGQDAGAVDSLASFTALEDRLRAHLGAGIWFSVTTLQRCSELNDEIPLQHICPQGECVFQTARQRWPI